MDGTRSAFYRPSGSNDFNADMDFEHPRWLPSAEHMPVFRRGGGGVVRHVYTVSAYFDPQTEWGDGVISANRKKHQNLD